MLLLFYEVRIEEDLVIMTDERPGSFDIQKSIRLPWKSGSIKGIIKVGIKTQNSGHIRMGYGVWHIYTPARLLATKLANSSCSIYICWLFI